MYALHTSVQMEYLGIVILNYDTYRSKIMIDEY